MSEELNGTLELYKSVCHANLTDGGCCGIFMIVKDGDVVCNECGESLVDAVNLLDKLSEDVYFQVVTLPEDSVLKLFDVLDTKRLSEFLELNASQVKIRSQGAASLFAQSHEFKIYKDRRDISTPIKRT